MWEVANQQLVFERGLEIVFIKQYLFACVVVTSIRSKLNLTDPTHTWKQDTKSQMAIVLVIKTFIKVFN